MTECESLQAEEEEVLASIYEGDDRFSFEPEKKACRYKYGEVWVFIELCLDKLQLKPFMLCRMVGQSPLS